MTKYEIIAESLQEKVNNGELTLEDARILNDVAYENYADDDTEYELQESFEDDGLTYEEYLESMEEQLFSEASARNRYVDNLEKKYRELYDKEDKLSDEYVKTKSKTILDEIRKIKTQMNDINNEISKYRSHNLTDSSRSRFCKGEGNLDKANSSARKAWSVDAKRTFGDGPLNQLKYYEQKGKKEFNKDFGGPSKDKSETTKKLDIKLNR